MSSEAPLREPGQHLTVPFNGATNSRAGLISCRLCLPQDGQNGRAVIFHMLLEGLPQADTLGVAAPTHKHHVQMLPDVV